MPEFTKRSVLPEKMDDASVSEKEIKQALDELEVINKWLGGYNVTLNALKNIVCDKPSLTIMDLGCGGGESRLRALMEFETAKLVSDVS